MAKHIERYVIGFAVGAIVTIGLFFLMQTFISNDRASLSEGTNIRFVEFVRVIEDVQPTQRQREIDPPQPHEIPPTPVLPTDYDRGERIPWDQTNYGSVAKPRVTPDIGAHVPDGEYLPISKVEPLYPKRAAERGIEGEVILEFTVNETGSVKDPVVIESDPPGIFDRAAIQAVLKFKYRPRVIDGQAIRVEGVKHRIVFNLEDEP